MKTSLSLFLFLCISHFSFAQFAYGTIDLSYCSVNTKFAENTSESITGLDVNLNPSGVGIGGSGMFVISKFAIGGGGGISILNSDQNAVKYNLGFGYGNLGYDLSKDENMLIIPSIRIGTLNNTLGITAPADSSYFFGTSLLSNGQFDIKSGGLTYGVQVDIIRLLPQVPGLVAGLSAYYSAPLSGLIWSLNGTDIPSVATTGYSTFGISLKIGGGGGRR